jgi:pyruvate dehydrogenase E2 component (dihydrolipoamide acetyltransferase)
MLSNFGMIAGRYATPVVVPPMVAILGSGRLNRDVIAVADGFEAHLRMPLSLTFDHRCVTGGEAARFMAAVLGDLQEDI